MDIQADPEDFQAARMVLFIKPFHVRQFFQAGWAVGGPEIDQQNFSPVAGDVDALFGDIQGCDWWWRFIDQPQLGNLVFTEITNLRIQIKPSSRVTVDIRCQ